MSDLTQLIVVLAGCEMDFYNTVTLTTIITVGCEL